MDAAVKELLSLKSQYKNLTGEDLAGGAKGGKKGGKEEKKSDTKKGKDKKQEGSGDAAASQKEDGKREIKKVTR